MEISKSAFLPSSAVLSLKSSQSSKKVSGHADIRCFNFTHSDHLLWALLTTRVVCDTSLQPMLFRWPLAAEEVIQMDRFMSNYDVSDMSQNSPISATKYFFLGTASGLHLEKDRLCIAVIRLNDLETINYRTNERNGYVWVQVRLPGTYFLRWVGRWAWLWTYEYSPGCQVSFHLTCILPILSFTAPFWQ